jgi:hypothetical protein
MSAARTAARLMRLYPPSWRARYGEELETLILEMSAGRRIAWRVRADVAGAGGRERLRGLGLGGDGSARARARGGAALVLWAWALFVLAGAIVQRTSEHWDTAVPGTHALASRAFDGLLGVAVVASVLVLAGIGLTLGALLRFLRDGGWPQIRRAVIVAGLMTALLVAATVVLVAWAHGLTPRDRQGHDTGYAIAFLAWAALGAGTLVCWTAAATRTAARLSLGDVTLRFQTWLAVSVSVAMAVMAAATVVWWIAVADVAPAALTGSSAGHASALVPQLVVAMALMVVATALGVTGARRAGRAVREFGGATPA